MIALVFGFFAYLLGSISSAIVVSKIFGLEDPRNVGSGNPGATNVLRSGNKTAAGITLAGDILKGFIPVLIANLATNNPIALAFAALGTFLGHLYPLYYGFKGGKGVATMLGIFLALNPLTFLAMALIWLMTAKIFKISSLASLTAAGTALFISFFSSSIPILGATFAIVALLFWKHKDNIERLRAGTESKIGEKSK